MKRSRGYLSSYTRRLKRERKLTANDFVKDIKVGDKVVIDVQPYYEGALPHPRYNGKSGVVKEIRGKAYVVEIKVGNKVKHIISEAVHIRKVAK